MARTCVRLVINDFNMRAQHLGQLISQCLHCGPAQNKAPHRPRPETGSGALFPVYTVLLLVSGAVVVVPRFICDRVSICAFMMYSLLAVALAAEAEENAPAPGLVVYCRLAAAKSFARDDTRDFRAAVIAHGDYVHRSEISRNRRGLCLLRTIAGRCKRGRNQLYCVLAYDITFSGEVLSQIWAVASLRT